LITSRWPIASFAGCTDVIRGEATDADATPGAITAAKAAKIANGKRRATTITAVIDNHAPRLETGNCPVDSRPANTAPPNGQCPDQSPTIQAPRRRTRINAAHRPRHALQHRQGRAGGRRESKPLADSEVVERLWHDFAELGPLEPNAIDIDDKSAEEAADLVARRLREGLLAP
jgi:hypothetical protein